MRTDRRQFILGAGVTLALPLLDYFLPRARAGEKARLAKLKQTQEDDANLLDRTMVFLGSNLGDGSSHSVRNLPVLLAGGGFKHGQHLPFDPQNSPPLCNLYVSMLQRLGIETDKFGTSTSALNGLESTGS